MSSDVSVLDRTFEQPHYRHRPQLGRALRALRRLLEHPDETQNAFEVGYALDGEVFEAELAQVLRHREGRRIFYDRPSLLEALADSERLARMPDGSLGRAYLDHMRRYGLDTDKLVELRRTTDPQHADRDEDLRWFVERDDVMHDLWHVLAGYGADGAGEAALLPFSLAQQFRWAGVLLTFGAGLRILRHVGLRWIPYACRAWQRGRRAAPLRVLPYEEMLPLPLDDVRRAVGIEPPARAHRGGVLTDDDFRQPFA